MKIDEKHGEIIGFCDADFSTPVYIRGHVTPEEAAEALAELCAEVCGLEKQDPCDDHRPGEMRHCWARWMPIQDSEIYDPGYIWRTQRSAAPGWAKVTKVDTVTQVEARR
jgi:hypothetical protein